MTRVEGPDKVTGAAKYAFEYPVPDAAYGYPVLASIASGKLRAFDATGALAMPGVLAVLGGVTTRPFGTENFELALFTSDEITYRGQLVGVVVADTLENARAAAAAVRVGYEPRPHDAVLRAGHPGLYRPEKINPALPTDTGYGDVTAGLAAAAARVNVTYTTPVQHNNPMEPHAAIAAWDDAGALTVWDSTQGPAADRDTIAATLGLPPQQVRVISPHVGGGFGSKGTTRPHAILAALAAREVGRPVKVALTRQQMFTLTGHRTPTIQRLELGATADGRLTAVAPGSCTALPRCAPRTGWCG
jgi:xanthine dehydrogenase YagR molybdenum-binding subunit